MTKKTFTDAFGVDSLQDFSNVTASKNPMVAQGLIADVANTPQSLINAFCKFWSTVFTNNNRVTNPDETVIVTYDGQTTRTEGANVYRVDTYRIQFYKLTPQQPPNPNDY